MRQPNGRGLRITPDYLLLITANGHAASHHSAMPAITVEPKRPTERIAGGVRRRPLPTTPRRLPAGGAAVDKNRRQWETVQRQRAELLSLPGAGPSNAATAVWFPGRRCEQSSTGSTYLQIEGVDFVDAFATLKQPAVQYNSPLHDIRLEPATHAGPLPTWRRPMFRPADHALTELERCGRHVVLGGSLGACKDLAEALHLWCVASDEASFEYAGVAPTASATIRRWDGRQWAIFVPPALLEAIL